MTTSRNQIQLTLTYIHTCFVSVYDKKRYHVMKLQKGNGKYTLFALQNACDLCKLNLGRLITKRTATTH